MANSQELNSTALLTDGSIEGYYRFNTGALTTDSSGNTRTLTNNNTVGESASGKFGYAADFTSGNTNKDFSITSNFDIDGGNFTYIVWVNNYSNPSANEFDYIYQESATSKVSSRIAYRDAGGTPTIDFKRTRRGVADTGPSVAYTIPTSTWTQLAITYDGTNIRGYANGVLIGGPTADSGNGSSASASKLRIGSQDGGAGSYAKSLMDDVAIFSRALTTAEILDLYDHPAGGMWLMF